MEILIGVLCAMAVVLSFCAGVLVAAKLLTNTKSTASLPAAQMTEEETEQMQIQRRHLREQQEAFQAMQNYNAEQAYGGIARSNKRESG